MRAASLEAVNFREKKSPAAVFTGSQRHATFSPIPETHSPSTQCTSITEPHPNVRKVIMKVTGVVAACVHGYACVCNP
ncbi:hypothetical protein L3Y34_011026 [Caenorhabditis briggsae]|uniref:Uncharacterized protein n=1 Tax=Caenorhabditis briggsae TaxID=6238 RepID=A0AAE9CTY1_CAEBR|nr:hypothetical protein L3Y34_011026 [Caenorhabditis briggsae]